MVVMKKIFLVFFAFVLVGCKIGATGSTGPQITIAKVYAIALTVDTNREVHLTGQVTIPTPYRYKLVDLDWLAAFDITFNKAQESQNTLYLLYEDTDGSIIQDTYVIDHPFEITFASDEWVRKIKHDDKGNFVVFVDIRNATVEIPPVTTSGEQQSITDNFYDLPEDGEVLNRFCTDDWETCRSVANANWQDLEVASIGGSFGSDGYLIERTFLFFDTSAIPSSATIQSATLYIYAGQWLNGNTTIHVVRSTANTPLTTGSYKKFSNESGGSVSLATPFDWANINLDGNALNWIVPNGITTLALIHDNDLYDNVPSEQNEVVIAAGEDSINRPYLIITYMVP
jgi:hypothetical protein